jgi:hypothetical protein
MIRIENAKVHRGLAPSSLYTNVATLGRIGELRMLGA